MWRRLVQLNLREPYVCLVNRKALYEALRRLLKQLGKAFCFFSALTCDPDSDKIKEMAQQNAVVGDVFDDKRAPGFFKVCKFKWPSVIIFFSVDNKVNSSQWYQLLSFSLHLISPSEHISLTSLKRQVFGLRVQMRPCRRQFKWIWSGVSRSFWCINLEKWSVRMVLPSVNPAAFGV